MRPVGAYNTIAAGRGAADALVARHAELVKRIAWHLAGRLPPSVEVDDLIQAGMIGLLEAAGHYSPDRGASFETYAGIRIRGAMIDALRKDAWPRGVRRMRRELEAAREKLRAQLGHEPSLADLAQAMGSDEKRLGKTIVRINTIESTSPFTSSEQVDESQLPPVMVPAEPDRPDTLYEQAEVRERVRRAIETLPQREQRVIALYYYGDVTMKDIGSELGVNESRVSQLHARALRRLRDALGVDAAPRVQVAAIRSAILSFARKPTMLKASLRTSEAEAAPQADAPGQRADCEERPRDVRVGRGAGVVAQGEALTVRGEHDLRGDDEPRQPQRVHLRPGDGGAACLRRAEHVGKRHTERRAADLFEPLRDLARRAARRVLLATVVGLHDLDVESLAEDCRRLLGERRHQRHAETEIRRRKDRHPFGSGPEQPLLLVAESRRAHDQPAAVGRPVDRAIGGADPAPTRGDVHFAHPRVLDGCPERLANSGCHRAVDRRTTRLRLPSG